MFGMSEEAFNEMQDDLSGAYIERCKQTELDALRADHFDPHADEWFDAEREEFLGTLVEPAPLVEAVEPSEWDVVLAPLAEPPF